MRWLLACVLFVLQTLPMAAQVVVTRHEDRISVAIDGKPFTELFVKGEEVAKPYFHPLRSASGKIVTRLYPMRVVEGESHDHPHHRGLWFAHGDVNGYDFWSADPSRSSPKLGRIVLEEIVETTGGEKHGRLRARFAWQAPDGTVLVREDRTVIFYSDPKLRILDLDLVLTGVKKAHFGDTKEGTFAIRVADSMNERHGGTLISSTGATGEKKVWGKRFPWMDYYGKVDGETLGIAIFDHPDNPGHPTHWHVRGYGLFAANIFGLHDFYRDESRDGGRTLEPGAQWRFRYRVVIHPGDPDSAGIGRLYAAYAAGNQ